MVDSFRMDLCIGLGDTRCIHVRRAWMPFRQKDRGNIVAAGDQKRRWPDIVFLFLAVFAVGWKSRCWSDL